MTFPASERRRSARWGASFLASCCLGSLSTVGLAVRGMRLPDAAATGIFVLEVRVAAVHGQLFRGRYRLRVEWAPAAASSAPLGFRCTEAQSCALFWMAGSNSGRSMETLRWSMESLHWGMDTLRWLGFGAFFVPSLLIGIRLLLLARRTGQIPELLIGIAVLGIGPLGYGLSILAFATEGRAAILSATLWGSGFLAVFIGAAALYLFVWYVFRRQQRWVRPLVFLTLVLLALSHMSNILHNTLVNRTSGGLGFWTGMLLGMLALAWSSLESLHYWVLMRRRMRFGLADPVVTNRFLLWGTGTGVAFLGMVLLAVIMTLSGFGAMKTPTVNLIVSVHGLVAAVAMWLVFEPPDFYLRFIESRSRSAAPARPPA